jgi:hypothetical protein
MISKKYTNSKEILNEFNLALYLLKKDSIIDEIIKKYELRN